MIKSHVLYQLSYGPFEGANKAKIFNIMNYYSSHAYVSAAASANSNRIQLHFSLFYLNLIFFFSLLTPGFRLLTLLV
jgi:hypothetical protein